MKVDYSAYPILRDIESGKLESMKAMSTCDETGFTLCMNLLNKMWAHVCARVRTNVCLPCNTYIEAIEKSSPCFDKLISNATKDDKHISPEDWVDNDEIQPITAEEQETEDNLYGLFGDAYGCYLLKGGQGIVYGMGKEPCKHDFAVEFVGDRITRAFVQYGEDYAYFLTNYTPVAQMYKEVSPYPIAIIAHLKHECQMFVMFERYAKTETRYLNPKTKVRVDLKSFDTTANETRIKVNVRDSRYFTNIIRDKGFMVKGHLRLQPKKVNGEWTRELIYIDSFEKHGYHRNAQIVKA